MNVNAVIANIANLALGSALDARHPIHPNDHVNLRLNCVVGMDVDRRRITEIEQASLMRVTALTPLIGYDKAAEIAHAAHADRSTLKQAALRLGYLSTEQFVQWVDSRAMRGPVPLKHRRSR
jgi:fumarate hydratase class II